ncbi:alpha/beta hydrolase [Flavobacterium sp. NRK1]|uniref:alpha/beta hydrolase n=1 Tax=Flavobacterium sp. NRK1 TaxID=2954929 RepID=UPI002093F292|nr:alpha/beta hydrolase [Flavobacterium sp. NRK1]MCO6149380.1 alpha/beta hydrolase [Flavobacterium sp. NRK1]
MNIIRKIISLLFFFIAFNLQAQHQEDILNLAYGKNNQQTLDLFLPKTYTTSTPVLVMLHGGAWSLGGKEYTHKTSKDLRDRGFIVANVDYRYVGEAVHATDLLEDIDNAVIYLQKMAAEKGFNTNQFNMAGISAGAHLALLYGYTSGRNIKSISALCAPSKFDDIKTFEHIQKLGLIKTISFLANDNYTADNFISKFTDISPYQKVKQLPTLLVHGTKDELVDYQQSADLYKKLQEKNIKSKLVTMKGKGHDVGMNQPDSEAKVLDEITNWIKTYN